MVKDDDRLRGFSAVVLILFKMPHNALLRTPEPVASASGRVAVCSTSLGPACLPACLRRAESAYVYLHNGEDAFGRRAGLQGRAAAENPLGRDALLQLVRRRLRRGQLTCATTGYLRRGLTAAN